MSKTLPLTFCCYLFLCCTQNNSDGPRSIVSETTTDKVGMQLRLPYGPDALAIYSYFFNKRFSVLEGCPEFEGQVYFSEKSFRIDHTVCDVDEVDFTEDKMGLKLGMEACRSDGEVQDKQLYTLSTDKDENLQLITDNIAFRLYQCEEI